MILLQVDLKEQEGRGSTALIKIIFRPIIYMPPSISDVKIRHAERWSKGYSFMLACSPAMPAATLGAFHSNRINFPAIGVAP